ncbi:MAG: 50S ribosome-binding GTPase [Acidobacteria bacterium]|nr:50S ribosome-binding GTPase [Acidobacteriota bacterium]
MRDLLRLSTAGSVDDGKSTLIGRLLYESGTLLKDQFASLKTGTDGEIPWAHLTDGLKAEREQGITIDVAYRFFQTQNRKYIVADTPGHAEFTRNMATGASTADCALILIDAQRGIRLQSKRHAFISLLMGIPHFIFAINKMDLVQFDRDRFDQIEHEMRQFLAGHTLQSLHFVPISALRGDNITQTSEQTPWYRGRPLLDLLEDVPVVQPEEAEPFVLPVQYVMRPDANFRGYAGTLARGSVRAGSDVLVLPAGHRSRITQIYNKGVAESSAQVGNAITLTLEDELAISRGDVLVSAEDSPELAHELKAQVVWFNQEPLRPGQHLILKHSSQVRRVSIESLNFKYDMHNLEKQNANRLELNEIGLVTLHLHRPLVALPFSQNKVLGSFILIDPVQNYTLGAGLISEITAAPPKQDEEVWFDVAIQEDDQALEMARLLETLLFRSGVKAIALDARKHPEAIGDLAQIKGILPLWSHLNAEASKERLSIHFHSEETGPNCEVRGNALWINRRFVSPDEAAHLIHTHLIDAWMR